MRLGQADAGGEGGLGLGAVEFSHFRPLTLASLCAALPAYELAWEEPPGDPDGSDVFTDGPEPCRPFPIRLVRIGGVG